jgi:hypothetical protein
MVWDFCRGILCFGQVQLTGFCGQDNKVCNDLLAHQLISQEGFCFINFVFFGGGEDGCLFPFVCLFILFVCLFAM